MQPFTVAIIDDHESIQVLLKKILLRIFGDRILVVVGSTVATGQQLLRDNRPRLFLVDGCLNALGQWDTQPLIASILEAKIADPAYKCTVIAISSDESINRRMVAAGSDIYINKERLSTDLIDQVHSLIG